MGHLSSVGPPTSLLQRPGSSSLQMSDEPEPLYPARHQLVTPMLTTGLPPWKHRLCAGTV